MKQRPEPRVVSDVTAAVVMLLAVIAVGCANQEHPPQPIQEEAKPMNATSRHFFNTEFGDVHYIDIGSSDTPPRIWDPRTDCTPQAYGQQDVDTP